MKKELPAFMLKGKDAKKKPAGKMAPPFGKKPPAKKK